MSHPRPPTTAECLRHVAAYLDCADRAVTALAKMHGQEVDMGRSVQGDLLVLAAWLDEHPDVDTQMHTVLEAVEVA